MSQQLKILSNFCSTFFYNNFYFFSVFIFDRSENRQFRIEQRDDEGNVKGEYGFIDRRGKLHMTKYSSTKEEGFKVEQVPT